MEYLPDITHLHYLGLFILLIAGGVGLPFPEDATLILCGVLISAGDIKVLPAILTVYAGLLCGDTILYHIGKKFGRKVVTHKWFHRVLTAGKAGPGRGALHKTQRPGNTHRQACRGLPGAALPGLRDPSDGLLEVHPDRRGLGHIHDGPHGGHRVQGRRGAARHPRITYGSSGMWCL